MDLNNLERRKPEIYWDEEKKMWRARIYSIEQINDIMAMIDVGDKR